jgi:hypothetical protein
MVPSQRVTGQQDPNHFLDRGKRIPGSGAPAQPAALRAAGHFISFVFHPLFIPSYVAAFLLFVHPYAYIGLLPKFKLLNFISVFFTTAFMPAFSVLLLKKMGFIQTLWLRTQRDRIIPYMLNMIYYFSVWYLARIQPDQPRVFVAFMLGVFLSSIAGMMANIYFKISMHGIGVGVLIIFFLWQAFAGSISLGPYLALATLITGMVCTARLLVSDHSPYELYSGLALGICCQSLGILFAA